MRRSVIYFSPELRQLWPVPLAEQWASHYPRIFDSDDLRNARHQPRHHFAEWLAAIHLFHRDGVVSLVEKYTFANHARKRALMSRWVSFEDRRALAMILSELRVQPPDLLVFNPETNCFGFAEVKGPRDRLRDRQILAMERIQHELGVGAEVIEVRQAHVEIRSRSAPLPRGRRHREGSVEVGR
jgi:hypothetical protein